MSTVLPEFLEAEYRITKRITRIVLVLAMLVPTYLFGPLLWQDGSYAGRWTFAADIDERPVECKGLPYLIQSCQIKFPDRAGKRLVTLGYLVIGTDWSEATTDIVRSSTGHFTSSIAVTGQGMFTRISAFLGLFIFGLMIEGILRWIKLYSLRRKVTPRQPPSPAAREAALLSRDRRDHL